MVIATVQLHSTRIPLKFFAGLDLAPGITEISNDENPQE